MKQLNENLNGENKHYLFPFFWQHGESEEILNHYVDKMLEQGIYNMCIESRPHPDFMGEGWWKTMDFLVKKAKENQMKIWILDDAKFPTGFANGKVPDYLKKRYLNYRRFDFSGPNSHVEVNLTNMVDMRAFYKDSRHQNDQLFKAILVLNDTASKNAFDESSLQDVTTMFKDGILHLSLEAHDYSLFVLYHTECGEEDATKEYLDPMRKEATQILLDEVYQKHYQRYKDEFGKTIVAFFSDEPRFGNTKGPNAIIGKTDMPLPWNDEVWHQLSKREGFIPADLVFLFQGESKKASETRFMYMDVITQLYSDNFTKMIGDWCHQHQVDYLGHTIEDNNAHARLGYGAGHYFRGIAGQHMAGIDIIGGQVVPGMDYYHDAFSTGGSDGEFYHYALVNMGASAAKLDPKKNGTLMCEAFGAYGWIEGLKMMQWITNHMLSHGVNLIVPHAFSPKEFPDWDCPPHFYAHGHNPQYPYFHLWSNYADRLCHLLSSGYKIAKVGVLYHGFAEWSGEAMMMQKVMKVLQQHQVAHDVISEDYLLDAEVRNGRFVVCGYEYETLVIPYVQYLPQELISKIQSCAQFMEVIFIDGFPDNTPIEHAKVSTLETLSQSISDKASLELSEFQPHLVCYPYQQEKDIVYMLFNESIHSEIKTTIFFDGIEDYVVYDAYTNETYKIDLNELDKMNLRLEPYQAIILAKGKAIQSWTTLDDLECVLEITEASVCLNSSNQEISSTIDNISLHQNIATDYQNFTGTITYQMDLDTEDVNRWIHFPEVYEIVEVIANDIHVKTMIAPPYLVDLSQSLKVGHNKIEVKTTNNLSRQMRDPFSMYIPLEPLGIQQPIRVCQKKHR